MALSAHEEFEAMAREWEASGSVVPDSPSELLVMRLYLWIHSQGAKADGVSEELQKMVATFRARLDKGDPDWYENQWDGRDFCRVCKEQYRMENLSMCTHCSALYGPCHRGSGGLAPNGNYRCGACESGEIIG